MSAASAAGGETAQGTTPEQPTAGISAATLKQSAQGLRSAALAHLSALPGIGGTIKAVPDHFLVEEITANGEVLELGKKAEPKPADSEKTKFTHFILQKNNWGTLDALRAIGKQLGCGKKRFSYAGLKDRNALTTQLAGVFAIAPERVLGVCIKDIEINGAWYANDKVRMGELGGNRFTIVVEGVCDNADARTNEIYNNINGKFPNYFGEQRFGMRGNTHEIGAHVVKGDFEGAVMGYLCDAGVEGMEENAEISEARRKLFAERNFAEALKYFPAHLFYERAMIEFLSRNPTDYANALRQLPRGLTLIFIHALQSHVFNLALSERIRSEEITSETNVNEMGNLVGYETKATEAEMKILENYKLTAEDFRLKRMPELSSKGTTRQLLAELKDFSFAADGTNGRFRFALSPGCYATSALREFLDAEKQ